MDFSGQYGAQTDSAARVQRPEVQFPHRLASKHPDSADRRTDPMQRFRPLPTHRRNPFGPAPDKSNFERGNH